jgi:hypothetical protein
MQKNKRGQLDISFGMIFSIILIIIFLAFGFYAIKKFMDLQSEVQIKQFLDDFQTFVDKIRKSNGEYSQYKDYSLPTKITSICFQDGEFENLKFNSKGIIRGKMIEYLDIESTLSGKDELCIPNTNGKVKFRLVKDYGETLVTITK